MIFTRIIPVFNMVSKIFTIEQTSYNTDTARIECHKRLIIDEIQNYEYTIKLEFIENDYVFL